MYKISVQNNPQLSRYPNIPGLQRITVILSTEPAATQCIMTKWTERASVRTKDTWHGGGGLHWPVQRPAEMASTETREGGINFQIPFTQQLFSNQRSSRRTPYVWGIVSGPSSALAVYTHFQTQGISPAADTHLQGIQPPWAGQYSQMD